MRHLSTLAGQIAAVLASDVGGCSSTSYVVISCIIDACCHGPWQPAARDRYSRIHPVVVGCDRPTDTGPQPETRSKPASLMPVRSLSGSPYDTDS